MKRIESGDSSKHHNIQQQDKFQV